MLKAPFCPAILTAAMLCASPAGACDLCSVFSAIQARGQVGKGLIAGVAEQFTRFSTLQSDGREVPNTEGQFLDSSISQVLLVYDVTERLGVQAGVPLIYRSFRRPEDSGVIRNGTESGPGDVSLLGTYQAWVGQTMNSTFTVGCSGGSRCRLAARAGWGRKLGRAPRSRSAFPAASTGTISRWAAGPTMG